MLGYDYGDDYKVNDVISIALDLENDTLTFYKNGITQGGSKYTPSSLGKTVYSYIRNPKTPLATYTANFGASEFKYPSC